MKSHLLVLSLAAALFPLSAMASACGGGGDELEEALQSLSEDDLAIMVLPQEELGDEFADLDVDEDSGFEDSRAAADDTIDPDDTAEDLEQAGWIGGYDLTYMDQSLAALEAGQGVISVGTEVEMFEDGRAASDFLAKQVDDFHRFEGEEIEAGVTLEKVETFAVGGLADEAVGVRQQASFVGTDMYGTMVAFRLDRLLGAATLARADDADANSQVEEIARALEERIRGVLLGEITGTPVPIPEAEEEEAEGRAPSEPPYPEEMALSLEDLPEAASIEQERYVEDPDMVSDYQREFDVSSVDVGSSRALSLTSEIELYADVREAAGVLQMREAGFTGESGRDVFESMLSEIIDITLIGYETPDVPGLGDGRVAIQYSYDSPFGEFDGVLINFRVGRAIGILTAEGLAGDIELADVVSLANAMAARMAAVLAAAGEETEEAAPSPEEARDILPQMILQPEDLPAGFEELFSSFDTLADQAEFSDDPDRFRRQLESWGFILSYSRFYTRDAAEGLLEVESDIWLLEDEQGAEEAFLDVALFPVFGDVDLEELPEFPSLGDNSEAFFLSGRYLPLEGEEIAAEGFTVVIRSGQFLAALTMAYRTGQASQDEAIELATALEAQMTR